MTFVIENKKSLQARVVEINMGLEGVTSRLARLFVRFPRIHSCTEA